VADAPPDPALLTAPASGTSAAREDLEFPARCLSRRQFLGLGSLLLLGCAAPARAARGRGAALPRRIEAEPQVRVALALSVPVIRFVPAGGTYLIHEARSDEPIAVAAAGEPWGIALRPGEAMRVVDPRGHLSRPHARPLRVDPLDRGSALLVGEGRYAGSLEVLQRADGLTAVNELPLEEYLRGVLGREMPAGEHALEALKAQAVAARTYALRRLGSRVELGFDLVADVQDQVYGGDAGATPAGDRALAATRGRVLLAGDHLVDALYHSTCGGATAAVEEAFPRPPVPYLRSVDDANGNGAFYCAGSRYFRWQALYGAEQVQRLLARNLGRFVAVPPGGPGELVDIEVVATSPAGRVQALRLETTAGRFQVARDDVRWLFAEGASPGLRSTLFLLRKRRSRGRLSQLTILGGGWGHGVGMCQMGALGRAAAGADAGEILGHYYRGTRVQQLYA
jgi:stage II sporulation protein D